MCVKAYRSNVCESIALSNVLCLKRRDVIMQPNIPVIGHHLGQAVSYAMKRRKNDEVTQIAPAYGPIHYAFRLFRTD